MDCARSGYNVIMNDETFTPCTKCGRPTAYCKGQCCGKAKSCDCQEYGPMVPGCIREVKPGCPYKAVIPTLTVEDKSNLKDLADCFVHVSNINTTFYIDDKHRTIVTWAGPVEYDNYDLDANTLGLRSQFLIDHANDYAAYYNKTGEYQKFNFSEGEGGENKYTVTLDWDNQSGTTPYAWDVPTPLVVSASSFLSGISGQDDSLQITMGGNSVSAADLLAAGDSLINASFAFEIPVAVSEDTHDLTENMAITARPTGVTNAASAVVVSGTYEVDSSRLLREPQNISLPPLRWKLAISKNGRLMTFTVESINILV